MMTTKRLPRVLLRMLVALPLVGLAACGTSSGSTDTTNGAATAIPAPVNVLAVPGNTQVGLTWQASTGSTGYQVKRALSNGAFAQVGATTATSYTDTGLANGTTYYYTVAAMIGQNSSPASAVVSATPSNAVTAPTVPANVAATAGPGQISISWNASGGAASYNLIRSGTSGGPYVLIAAPSATTFVDSGLTAGTPYFYRVSAVDAAGQSGNSAEVSAIPTAVVATPPVMMVPAVPTGLVAAAGISRVSLVWTASTGASSYNVGRATASGGPFTALATTTTGTYVDTAVTNATTYYYVVAAVDATGSSNNSAPVFATPIAPDVTVTINPASTQPISPYIYGIDFFTSVTGVPNGLTLDRAGGNRWTAYNWETNASNAGSDYYYTNDNNLSSSSTPAEAVRAFIVGDQSRGMATIMTFQMQGLVAADEAGPVSVANPPDMTRFKTVVDTKGLPFSLTPNTTDADVYMDEFAWAMDQKFSGQQIFGTAPTIQPVFANLDNQPELWNSTHLEVQGSSPVTSDAYISKTIALAEALKTQFPDMVLFGPAHFGFSGIYSWNGELTPTPTGNNWFPDKYLPAIKAAATSFGRPLVDVYDFHWYSEATDGNGNRVTNLTGPNLDDDQIAAIVESPRSLWDTTYVENSYITGIYTLNGPIYILGRLQARIAAENPGMKIALTEYANGGGQHIAGTVAQADNLGVFGANGVFAANLEVTNSSEPYTLAGFTAFRDFDGANSNFGDVSLQATSSNVAEVAAYASTDSTQPGRTVFVVINRSQSSQVVNLTGQPLTGTAHLYQMSATSAAAQSAIVPVAAGTLATGGSSLALTLPPLSVTTVDVH